MKPHSFLCESSISCMLLSCRWYAMLLLSLGKQGSLCLEVISKVSPLFFGHGQVGGPHSGRVSISILLRVYRWGWRASSYQRHILIPWISPEKSCVVHVLRHWGIGDSRGGRVQAGLAAHAAAVAAEAVHVGVVRVLRP